MPYSEELKRRAPRPACKAPAPAGAATATRLPAAQPARPVAPQQPASAEQQFFTGIAARPTQASLFNRPASPATRVDAAIEKAPADPKAAGGEQAKAPAKVAAVTPGAPQAVAAERKADIPAEEVASIDTSAPRRAWSLPALGELEEFNVGEIDEDEKRSKARVIEYTLASFRIEAQVVGINTGPAVTQFELQPAVGVKVSKITTLERDLALALAAPSIRIEAPIPGKAVVGIEIPNSAISLVGMRDVVVSEEFERVQGQAQAAARQGCLGHADRHRAGAHAAPADRRQHRHRQDRGDQLRSSARCCCSTRPTS